MTSPLESGQKNLKIKATHGGKRLGAGRKNMHGEEEVSSKMKRKFNEYVSEETIEAIVAAAIADALSGKTDMQKFLLDQWFGKATMKIANEDGEALLIKVLSYKDGDNHTV